MRKLLKAIKTVMYILRTAGFLLDSTEIRRNADTGSVWQGEKFVVIVTGGNSGTGYATCKALYDKGATVYLACRNLDKGQKAIEDIKRGGVFTLTGIRYPSHPSTSGSKGKLICLELDLADLESVKRFSEDFRRRESKLDLLFANAGVMASPSGLYTKQGYSLQFGTNTLAHQLLIARLLPLLQETARSQPESPPRIILTSSAGHSAAPWNGVDYRSVIRESSPQEESSRVTKIGRYERAPWIEYGQSKWGNIAIARWLHWVYGPAEGRRKVVIDSGADKRETMISIAVHPGLVATNLGQHLPLTEYVKDWAPWIGHLIAKPAADGASNQLWAATCPVEEARKLSGEYIVPFQTIGRARPDLDDRKCVEDMWLWCEKMAEHQH